MPIIIKDYEWSQDLETIYVRVPLKNVQHSTEKVNLFTYKTFIKINCPPYYLEIFLFDEISECDSKCKILDNEIKFILKKTQPKHWDQLTINIPKSNVQCEKEKIIESAQQLECENAKKRLEQQQQFERMVIHKEVDREATIREKIEDIKKLAVKNELKNADKVFKNNNLANKPPVNKKIFHEKKTEKHTIKVIPAIRKSSQIDIEFTARKFITPQRESQGVAEQEWLRKQNEARKTIGFCPDDLRPEERNPIWLKEQGNKFHKKENYLAALSAYTTAIQLNGKSYELYLNRSATHYQIGNYKRCAEDCTKALELLTPPIKSNENARIQCLVRRGAALSKLGFLQQGLSEMEAAAQLNPNDLTLKNDIIMIRNKIDVINNDNV